MHQKFAGSIAGQGTYLGCGFDPWLGYVREATDQCFSLSPPSSVSKVNKHILGMGGINK